MNFIYRNCVAFFSIKLFFFISFYISIMGVFCTEYYPHPLFYYQRFQHDITGLALDEENERLFILVDDLLQKNYAFSDLDIVSPDSGKLIKRINIATGRHSGEFSAGYFGAWGCDLDEKGNLYVNSHYGWAINKMVPPDFSVEYATTGSTVTSSNTAHNNTAGITVISENEFILILNRVISDVGPIGIQGWKNAGYIEGRQPYKEVLAFRDPRGIANDGTYVYVGNNNPAYYAVHALNASDYSNPQFFIRTGNNRIIDVACDNSGGIWVLFENNTIRRYAGVLENEQPWKDHVHNPDFTFELPSGYGNFYALTVSSDGNKFYTGWSKGHNQPCGVMLFTSERYTFAHSWSLF